MIRTAYRVIYLIVLVAVLARLLVYPAGWEEERLPVSLLIALHVREAVATSRALWKTGRRRLRLWQKRRRARRTKSRVKVKRDLVALAAQMLPDPEPWPWVEEAAMTALKVSLRGLFTLIPEAVCAKLFLCVRWVGGVRCPRCGCKNVTCKDPHYRKYYLLNKVGQCSRGFHTSRT